jgi:hypothetical protein
MPWRNDLVAGAVVDGESPVNGVVVGDADVVVEGAATSACVGMYGRWGPERRTANSDQEAATTSSAIPTTMCRRPGLNQRGAR